MRFPLFARCGWLVVSTLSAGLFAQGVAPSFSSHPASVSVFVGEAVTLSVTVEGDSPVSLQWRKNSAPIPSAIGSTFSISGAQLSDLALYNVVATNSSGSATSLSALLFVAKRTQAITFAPAVTTVTAGSGVTLAASASSGLPVTLTLVSGPASLNGNSLVSTGGSVVVRATQAGNDFYSAAETVDRTFNFVAGALTPFITSPPVDQAVTVGSAVTFRATAIGTPTPTFQWQISGVDLPGATLTTLTLAATTLADSARYTVTATNFAGAATASATLTVRSPPIIQIPPESRALFLGDSMTLSVTVSAFPAPTYQWRKNGAVIPGATRSTHTLASATAADAGRFDVVVTNALGSATSAAATLTVTARDFAGAYFGTFADSAGDCALLVRADRTAVFLGHLPGRSAALAALEVRLDLGGVFSVVLPTAATNPQSVTLRGTVNDLAGTVTGTVAELGVTFSGARSATTGPVRPAAGFYTLGVIGSATGRGFAIVAPDGQASFLTTDPAAPDSARGTLGDTGRLTATTASQAALDLGFTNGAVTGTLRPATGTAASLLGVSETRAGTERLVNLSVRSITTPAAPLITGFVVTGPAAKQLLVRAAGPALVPAPFSVPNALTDPALQILRGAAAIAQNDDWGVPAANTAALNAAGTRAGAFPFRAGSADAAILTTLAAGPYTALIGGGTGVALAEIYEVLENNEPAGARRLVNVSARGLVTPAAPLIAGFVVTGVGPQRVLLRGIGPTLGGAPFGVAGVLVNPVLTLFRDTTALKTNDDWFRDSEAAAIRDAAARSGAFALGASSLDAAILIFLEPGAYTVQLSAAASAPAAAATGIALVEIYEATR